jgi:hypothetical protein
VFRIEDFQADEVTNVGSTPLLIPGGADQMLLSLDRRRAVDPLTGLVQLFPVTASFQFFDGGAEDGGVATLGGSITPFLYEDRMRIDILVSTTVVPVPGSLALLLSGVAIAGLAARKRGRNSTAVAL